MKGKLSLQSVIALVLSIGFCLVFPANPSSAASEPPRLQGGASKTILIASGSFHAHDDT